MDGVKTWLKSSGVWGGIISGLAGVLGLFGYVMTPDDQAVLTSAATHASELVLSATALIGGVLSVIGRVRATKTIGKAPADAK